MLSRIPTAWRRKKINQSARGSCLEIFDLDTDSNLFQPRLPLKTGTSGHIIWTIEPALTYTEAGGELNTEKKKKRPIAGDFFCTSNFGHAKKKKIMGFEGDRMRVE